MAHASLRQSSAPGTGPRSEMCVPSYTDVGGGRVVASFDGSLASDGHEIERGRSRAYPGLISAAPRTDAIYRAFNQFVRGRTVLDVGCGAGVGLMHLSDAELIRAVDIDPTAVWFVKNALEHVEVSCVDATKSDLPLAEVALVVDVLGQVGDPRDVLRRVGKAVGEGGLMCIAEPHASIAQELMKPVRRAFSKPQLEALLVDGGFVIQEWLSAGGFLVAVAVRNTDAWTRGLEAADQLYEAGLQDEALDLLTHPPEDQATGATPAWYLRLGEMCLARGDGDGALEALLAVQARAPDDARVLSTLAQLSMSMGSMDDAARFAIAAAERDPADPSVALALAQAVGDRLTAAEKIALWANAARLAPDDVDVAVALSRVAAGQSAYHIGIRALERVREYHPTLPGDFHLTLGWMYLMSARVEDALMECRLAKIVDAENPAIAELLAAICEVRPRPFGVS